MKKEINLEELFGIHFNGLHFDDITKENIVGFAVDACHQCLDLAAENATTTRISYFDGTESQQLNGIDIWEEDSSVPCYLAITDKDSILQIKDWIK